MFNTQKNLHFFFGTFLAMHGLLRSIGVTAWFTVLGKRLDAGNGHLAGPAICKEMFNQPLGGFPFDETKYTLQGINITYPTKREVGKIIDSKWHFLGGYVSFLEGICIYIYVGSKPNNFLKEKLSYFGSSSKISEAWKSNERNLLQLFLGSIFCFWILIKLARKKACNFSSCGCSPSPLGWLVPLPQDNFR